MYVCNCNGIRRGQVEEAIRNGANSPKAVHAACGHAPQCGRCLPEIAARLREARAVAPAAIDAAIAR